MWFDDVYRIEEDYNRGLQIQSIGKIEKWKTKKILHPWNTKESCKEKFTFFIIKQEEQVTQRATTFYRHKR